MKRKFHKNQRLALIPPIWKICFDFLEKDLLEIFETTCANGNLEDAIWIWKLGFVSTSWPKEFKRCFLLQCQNNYVNLAKWFWNLKTVEIFIGQSSQDERDILKNACVKNSMNMVRWCLTLKLSTDTIRNAFCDACRFNRLTIVQMIHKSILHDQVLMKRCFYEGWCVTCTQGHLDIGKFLRYFVCNSDIDNGFVLACTYGHLNIVQYIYEQKAFEHEAETLHEGFSNACSHDFLVIVKFILSCEVLSKKQMLESIQNTIYYGDDCKKVLLWFRTLNLSETNIK